MLKEKYEKISFPLKKKDPESVANSYLSEFGSESVETIKGLKVLFAHILRDYLQGNVGECELGSLCFYFLSNKEIADKLENDLTLKKFIFECLDIMWLSESSTFNSYLIELEEYLVQLKKELNS